ncbi:MAG: PEP-CTERM sorting domain-containing protein [Pseudomonadota bacterium]
MPFRKVASIIGMLAMGSGHVIAATETHTATFKGAGGDASYGNGDIYTNTALYGGFLPLFDSTLGTLEKVSIEMDGWRSVSFDCTTSSHTLGSCNARADGAFFLRADSYNPYQFPMLGDIRMNAGTATVLSPYYNETLSAISYASANALFEVTDPSTLAIHFDGAGKDPNSTYLTLWFASYDGGAFGYGGGSGMTSLYWDADATISLTYHYVAAVPEPETYALLLAGLGLVGWTARRRMA